MNKKCNYKYEIEVAKNVFIRYNRRKFKVHKLAYIKDICGFVREIIFWKRSYRYRTISTNWIWKSVIRQRSKK